MAHAQIPTGVASAALTVEASAFPAQSAYLAVTDAQGASLSGHPATAFALTEDNQAVTQFTVAEAEVGVQTVFVIDTSAAFKARDANGITRLEYIQQALTDYAQNVMRDGVDDVTVLAAESLLIGHSAAGHEVAAVVNAYATEFNGAADPASVYNAALDYAASLTPRPGMQRAVVLLSNGFAGQNAATQIGDLAARATAARVPIHAVFIGPLGAGNTADAQTLRALAEQTGGAFIIYESIANLAPLFQRLADQRTQYQLTYRSAIASTAQHVLVARVMMTDGVTLNATASFPLRVEPPTVALGAVPAAVQRLTDIPGAAPQSIDPVRVAIPFTVDFPDHHPRAVRAAQLLVNGQAAETRSAPPFESFEWSIADIAASGTYTLAVSLTDELGLTALSDSAAVVITVTIPPAPLLATTTTGPMTRNWDGIVLAAVGGLALAALAGGGGWLLLRRRAPVAAPPITAPAPKPLPTTAPLMQPQPRPRAGPLKLPRRPVRVRPGAAVEKPKGRAYFEVVDPGGGGAPLPDIELFERPLRLGRDGAVAEVVFHDRSVSRLHARLEAAPEGAFRIFDEGSTSGTWVNFTALAPGEGWTLKPGDLVNLGRVQLRFKCRDIQSPSEAVQSSPPA